MTLLHNSNAFAVSIVANLLSGTAFALAANALLPGQTAAFTQEAIFDLQSHQWTGQWHYDPTRGIFHCLGKRANDDDAWRHLVYNASTDSWAEITVSSGMSAFNASGHIYDNSTIDPATGDLYLTIGNDGFVKRYDAAAGTWGSLSTAFGDSPGDRSSHSNGVVWHPNLFGPGDGGLIVRQAVILCYWRKSTDTWINTKPGSEPGDNTGVGAYFAANDSAIVGRTVNRIVTPNGGGTPNSVSVGGAPVNTAGRRVSDQAGVVVQHPGDPTKLLLLREGPSGDAWESTDGDNWTAIADHPLVTTTGGDVQLCPVEDYGVIWAIGYSDVGARVSTLWRPPV